MKYLITSPKENFMSLVPWKSTLLPRINRGAENELASFQRDIDEMMDTFWGRRNLLTPRLYESSFYPAIDVKEEDDKYLIEAELPGLTENDITLDLHNNILTIKGEKKSESKVEKADFVQTERYFGSFRRDIPFEYQVEPSKVNAELKKGILNIQLTKKEKSNESHKKIPIKH